MNGFDAVIEQLKDEHRVAFLGDWHGSINWARTVIRQAGAAGVKVLLHVGDFGVWPDANGEKYLRKVDMWCEEQDVYLLVTPGNHEDWTRLHKGWNKTDGKPSTLGLKRVWFMPLNTRFTLAGVSFLSFGGAASVDYTYRLRGKNWWADEFPSDEAVEVAVASGPADVLILHETPDSPYATPEVQLMLDENPMGFAQAGLDYSAESRQNVTEVLEAVKPKIVVHGHMHVGEAALRTYPSGEEFVVLSLDREHKPKNVATFDLRALTIELGQEFKFEGAKIPLEGSVLALE